MKKIQLLKKSLYLMITIAAFSPIMILSAREGRGGEQNRNMGSTRSHETNQNHEKAAYEHHTSPYTDEHHMNPYEGGGGYVAPVAAPTTPNPQSQPGMSDDSSALYNSYIHSNPPQR